MTNLSFFILVVIARLKAEECRKIYFKVVSSEGPSLLPEEIISSHNVEHPVKVNCNFLCFNTGSKCAGFNFRAKANAINCQLTNTAKNRNYTEEGEWTLYQDMNVASIDSEKKKPSEVQLTSIATTPMFSPLVQPTSIATTPTFNQLVQPTSSSTTPTFSQLVQPTSNSTTPRFSPLVQPTSSSTTPTFSQLLQPTSNSTTPRFSPLVQSTSVSTTPTFSSLVQPNSIATTPTFSPLVQPTSILTTPTFSPLVQPTSIATTPTFSPLVQPTSISTTPTFGLLVQPISVSTTPAFSQLTQTTSISTIAAPGVSCSSLYKSGKRKNGVYTINPDGLGSFQVRCNMQTGGGGWTVFQRRQDDSVDFYREWQDYKIGFGDLNGNFWLGLDQIHRLTKLGQNVLRVDLMDWTSDTAYAKYGSFSVASESENYRLDVGSYSGNAGDSLAYHNGMMFSTKDRDNDGGSGSCAQAWHGAWWYLGCHKSNLNGEYLGADQYSPRGVDWMTWKNDRRSMKKTEMKVRPAEFKTS